LKKIGYQGFVLFAALLIIVFFLSLVTIVFLPNNSASSKKHTIDSEKIKFEISMKPVDIFKPSTAVESNNIGLYEKNLNPSPMPTNFNKEEQKNVTSLAPVLYSDELLRPLEVVNELSISKGDTIFEIMQGLGVSPQEILSVIDASKSVFNLKRVVPGKILKVTFIDGNLKGLEYPIDNGNRLIIENSSSGFKAFKREIEFDIRKVFTQGEIKRSLYEDGRKAGLDPEIIMALADIFAWEIDFSVDLRENDSFKLLYEEGSHNGEVVKSGPILAAQFMNRDKLFTAIKFKDDDGHEDYYDLEGNSLRKQFLKSPLNYRRISSYFSNRRFHPILKKYRPHHGIDYAAPTGTPVAVTGDGKVIYSGWKKGYGKFIVIRHNSTYSTAYGHLSRIDKRIRKGRYVKQGQVIGYVGSTGISTGPHLHYEFRVNGTSVNPLGRKFAPAKPLQEKYKEDFEIVKETVMNRIENEGLDQVVVAVNDNQITQ
jgi:murein DD-endopeptidase MepM/ murein hydrolase activator NlpD